MKEQIDKVLENVYKIQEKLINPSKHNYLDKVSNLTFIEEIKDVLLNIKESNLIEQEQMDYSNISIDELNNLYKKAMNDYFSQCLLKIDKGLYTNVINGIAQFEISFPVLNYEQVGLRAKEINEIEKIYLDKGIKVFSRLYSDRINMSFALNIDIQKMNFKEAN